MNGSNYWPYAGRAENEKEKENAPQVFLVLFLHLHFRTAAPSTELQNNNMVLIKLIPTNDTEMTLKSFNYQL